MEYVIEKGPEYSVLKVKLLPGESITAEPGSYMLHRGEVEVGTGLSGGVFGALQRAFTASLPLFLNTFRARTPAEIWFVPSIPGDIKAVSLRGAEIAVQDTSYLAHFGDVKLGVAFKGFKGLLGEGEIFWLKASGSGTLFINSFGAIEELELGPGERVTLDNGHAVAIEGSVKWNIRRLGGFKTLFLGGEGLVIDAAGPGRIWIQTRTLAALASALSKYITKGEKK